VCALLKDFLLEHNHLSSSTLKSYKNILNRFDSFDKNTILTYFTSERFKGYTPRTRNLHRIVIKKYLDWAKIDSSYIHTEKIRERAWDKSDLPDGDDIEIMLRNTNAMGQCLIMLLLEMGGRISEILNLKIKDIEDKHTHYIITIRISKTKNRRIPVLHSIPYVSVWLNLHPDRDNREQYLFCHKRHGEFVKYSYRNAYKIVKMASKSIDKNMSPHLLRHAAATRDVKSLNIKSMMRKFGWSRQDMIDVYTHLDDTDLEREVLEKEGVDLSQMVEVKSYPEKRVCICGFDNPGTNKFCSNCGKVLDITTLDKIDEIKKIGESIMTREELIDLIMGLLKEDSSEEE
jgi:integrase